MKYNIQKTSLVDSPDGIATVIFCDKCNLKCDYCYAQPMMAQGGRYSFEEAAEVLKGLSFSNGKPKTDWLILSGGEITLDSKNFFKFVNIAKETGRKVGMYTSGGIEPEVYQKMYKAMDWINLDFKYLPEGLVKYCKYSLTNVKYFITNLEYSLKHPEKLRLMTICRTGYHLKKFEKMFNRVKSMLQGNLDWHIRSITVTGQPSLIKTLGYTEEIPPIIMDKLNLSDEDINITIERKL